LTSTRQPLNVSSNRQARHRQRASLSHSPTRLPVLLVAAGGAGEPGGEVGQGAQAVHVQAVAQEVFDVTGAGDTVTTTLAVALVAGASFAQAARLASRAAGIIVARLGTTAVRLEDLLQADGQAGRQKATAPA
jgi:bifunctional ADP-heptose synthase (sugar kinase/adenylyltransferase)